MRAPRGARCCQNRRPDKTMPSVNTLQVARLAFMANYVNPRGAMGDVLAGHVDNGRIVVGIEFPGAKPNDKAFGADFLRMSIAERKAVLARVHGFEHCCRIADKPKAPFTRSV